MALVEGGTTGTAPPRSYLILSLWSERVRHPRSESGARGFNCDGVTDSRQLATSWKKSARLVSTISNTLRSLGPRLLTAGLCLPGPSSGCCAPLI